MLYTFHKRYGTYKFVWYSVIHTPSVRPENCQCCRKIVNVVGNCQSCRQGGDLKCIVFPPTDHLKSLLEMDYQRPYETH
jgi:hypothetical protein